MMYTRNKDSFKAKTAKSTNNSRHSTLSQNGFNLVEELKQRIQNKNKVKNQPLNEDIDLNTQNLHKSYKSSAKITISKNIQANPSKIQETFIELTEKSKQIQESSNGFIPQQNTFSKLKKQPFIQLVDSQHHDANLQNEGKQKNIYQSPIQNLQLSGYSSNGRKTQQCKNENKDQTSTEFNKQIYENKVKKWRNREVFVHQPANLKDNYNKKNEQLQKLTHKVKYKDFGLISGIIQQSVNCRQSLVVPKSYLTGQKEYVILLENELSQIKTQLLSSMEKIKKLEQDSSKNLEQSNKMIKVQQELTLNIMQKQRLIHQNCQKSYLLTKYKRLLNKMRNLHIVNAMQMIQTKNFLELRFNSMNNELSENAPQQSLHKNKIKQNLNNQIFNDFQNCQLRINSMNGCIAKVEEIIQVSQKMISLSEGQSHLTSNAYISEITIKQLQQSLMYKDKIIKKLKDEINIIKMNEKLSNISQIKVSQPKQKILINPYSYVDEIHLLRHQITRLTQQNCEFYQKFIHLKSSFQTQHDAVKKFPNQSRIQQIQTLINKLDKKSSDQSKPNSKVQYWVNGKTDHQTNPHQLEKKKPKNNQNPKTSNIIMIQKPNFSKNEKSKSKKKGIYHSNQKNLSISKEEKVEYSTEDFFQLVKQFKSTLSGLTPQKQSKNASQTNKNSKQQLSNGISLGQKKEELGVFRSPKSQQYQSPIKDQEQKSNEQIRGQNFSEKISRLEYEKEFLASERENLLKQNDCLTQKITQLQNQIMESENINLLKQQIYKLNFQNQELVDRIVETQNLLMKTQKSPIKLDEQNKMIKLLKSQQNENLQLKERNDQLNLKISYLEEQKIKLTKALESTVHQDVQTLSYVFSPSFEALINFLRELPQERREYHEILLKMIESYEKKISQLREENVMMRTKQTNSEQILMKTQLTLQRVLKLFKNDKFMKQGKNSTFLNQSQKLSEFCIADSDQAMNKLNLQANIILSEISQLKRKQPFMESIQLNSVNDHNLVKSYLMRINYHLMFIRSLIQGIGESDLELIQGELSDYLKQLKKRIPTVLQAQQYDESNPSSLNSSIVNE